jgi:hypothetical protein
VGAQLFLKGISPYSPEGLRVLKLEWYGFGHPPTTPFWFLGFASMSWAVMAESLAFVVMLLLFAHMLICALELALPSPKITALLLFSLVLSAPFMIEHLHVQQISEPIAFLYVLAWYHLRHERDGVGGACLGLACTFKLFPGLMVIYLLFARRWRAVVGAVAAYLPVAAVMTWRYGWRSWPLFFKQQGFIGHMWMGHIRNASVHGVLLRLLQPLCVADSHVNPGRALLGAGVSLALLGAAWWTARRSLSARQDVDLTFALASVLSAFVNAWVWEHYRVLLVLPLLVLARDAWSELAESWQRWAREPSSNLSTEEMPLAASFAALATAAGIALVVFCLPDGIWDKELPLNTWHAGAIPPAARAWWHWRLHRLEVSNWLPWPLTIGLLMFRLRWRWRSPRLGAVPVSAVTAARV